MVYEPLKSFTRRYLTFAQQWILPPTCISCGGIGNHLLNGVALDLCSACYLQLPFNHYACTACGLPLPESSPALYCGQCLHHPPPYHAGFCAFTYRYPVSDLIRHFKYGHQLACARLLGELLAQYLQHNHAIPWPECIIPVPLHRKRYQIRGYNQTIELARFLHRRLNIPIRLDVLKRLKNTPEQAGLSREDRLKNLRQAFVINDVAIPTHVAILDDVITTGSTVHEVALTLKKAGVQHIEVWSVARAT